MTFMNSAKKTVKDMGDIAQATGQGVKHGVQIGVAFLPIIIALTILSRI